LLLLLATFGTAWRVVEDLKITSEKTAYHFPPGIVDKLFPPHSRFSRQREIFLSRHARSHSSRSQSISEEDFSLWPRSGKNHQLRPTGDQHPASNPDVK